MNCMNCGSAVSPGVRFCPRCGSPQAQQPAPPYTPPYEPPGGQMQTSWDAGPQGRPPRRKSRAGKILLIVFGVLLLIGAGAGLAAYYGYRYLESSLKSSEAYQLAEKELKRSPAVAERLGEIKSTGFPVGNFDVDAGGSGSAQFTVAVEGTKASGRYFVLMEREAGKWKIMRAFVQLNDAAEMIYVVGAEGEGGEGPEAGRVPAADDAGAAPSDKNAAGAKTVSGGVLNGKAINKPAPAYPAIAKTARASGTVVVQVEVDERGRVTKARATSGHPLLRAAAEAAARQASFSPTLLSGKPVRVSGVLTYEFKPE